MAMLKITEFARRLLTPVDGVCVTASARLDVSAMQRTLSAEQIDAVMRGIGRCIAVASASEPEPKATPSPTTTERLAAPSAGDEER